MQTRNQKAVTNGWLLFSEMRVIVHQHYIKKIGQLEKTHFLALTIRINTYFYMLKNAQSLQTRLPKKTI